MKVVLICCLSCAVLFGQVLYEEYFTDGNMALDWHPWFTDSLGLGDSMGVINDPSTPGGDGWAGRISNEYMSVAGLTYAGDSTLTDYSIEAWIYTVVATTLGPYNGIAIRMDPATHRYYRLVSDFDDSERLRLGLIGSAGYPVVLRDWTGNEIPGGAPSSSSWHKLKITVIADSIWCFYDDIELDGCPIIDDSVSHGYFGVYTFNMMDTSSTKCDNIIVQQEGAGVYEQNNINATAISIFPNPFSNTTVIRYEMRDESSREISVSIYDIAGRLIKQFNYPTIQQSNHMIWDGRDASGRVVSPGVYFITDGTERSLVKVVKIH